MLHKIIFEGYSNQSGTVAYPELGHQITTMGFHCMKRYKEHVGYFLSCMFFDDKAQDFFFSFLYFYLKYICIISLGFFGKAIHHGLCDGLAVKLVACKD